MYATTIKIKVLRTSRFRIETKLGTLPLFDALDAVVELFLRFENYKEVNKGMQIKVIKRGKIHYFNLIYKNQEK